MELKFNKRIKELRDKSGLSQAKFAKVLSGAIGKEIAISTIAMWEATDGRIPPAETLWKIADYFNVSVDYLLGREEPPPMLSEEREFLVKAVQELNKKLGI